MAKEKKRDFSEITPLLDNLEQNFEVQKSNPMFSLWKSSLSLFEFKVLDTYLSRINSHDPQRRTVRFEKGEMERLFGVTQIRPEELKEHLKHLMEQVVEIRDRRKKKGFVLITLFSKADCEKDDYGLWQVELTCSTDAMEYFFNVEEIGYLRYKLRSIINITSRYSYILFIYIESNRFRREWEVDLAEIKRILNCDSDETYSEYKHFNNLILKRCYNELTQKTELRYTYEPVKKGRRVIAIRFKISSLGDAIPVQETPPMIEQEVQQEDPRSRRNIEFLSDACNNEFSYEEMELIFSIISTMDFPPHPNGIAFSRYHYLYEKYAALNVQEQYHKITKRFSYFKAMIENDREKQQY